MSDFQCNNDVAEFLKASKIQKVEEVLHFLSIHNVRSVTELAAKVKVQAMIKSGMSAICKKKFEKALEFQARRRSGKNDEVFFLC